MFLVRFVFFWGLLNGELGKTVVVFFRELLKWEVFVLFFFFWENIPDTDTDSKSP